MVYTAVDADWSSTWTLGTYDNAAHNFQVTFSSGAGEYLPSGEGMSGVYEVSGPLLTIQLAQGLGAYPPLQNAGTCTDPESGAPMAECRLYIKGN